MPCAESIFWGEPECIPFHKANSHLPKFCFPILENKDTSRLASRAHTRPRDSGDGGTRGEDLDEGFSDSGHPLFEWPWSWDSEAEQYKRYIGHKHETSKQGGPWEGLIQLKIPRVTPGFNSWNQRIPVETSKPFSPSPKNIQFLGRMRNFTLYTLLFYNVGVT